MLVRHLSIQTSDDEHVRDAITSYARRKRNGRGGGRKDKGEKKRSDEVRAAKAGAKQ